MNMHSYSNAYSNRAVLAVNRATVTSMYDGIRIRDTDKKLLRKHYKEHYIIKNTLHMISLLCRALYAQKCPCC